MSDLRESVSVLTPFSPYELRRYRADLEKRIGEYMRLLESVTSWEMFVEHRGHISGLREALSILDDQIKRTTN